MSKKRGKLFQNRKSGNQAEPAAAAAPEQNQPVRKGRVEEPLLKETVWETVVDTFNGCPLFTVTRDGEKFFVGLYMPFSEIGGLSKKESKHNESKGSIVGQINHGKISVMNTAALAEKNAVIFVPTEETLTNMSEFSLLADSARYELCFINADTAELELTGVKVELSAMQGLYLDNRSVASIPGVKKMVDEVLDGPIRATAASSGKSVAEQPVGPVRTDAPISMAMDDDEDESSLDGDYGDSSPVYMEDPVEDNGADDVDFAPESAPLQDAPDDEFDSGEPVSTGDDDLEDPSSEAPLPDVDFTPQDTMAAIQRRFFNSDIQMELTAAPLDQALSDVIPFHGIIYRPGGWLDDQINARISVMNDELLALHQANIAEVRKQYLDGMTDACLKAIAAVDAFESSDEYAKLKELTDKYLEESSKTVAEQREALKQEFDAKAKEAGESARVEAEQRYRERYRWEYNQRSDAIENEVRTGIRVSFDTLVSRRKNEIRREEMAKLDEISRNLIGAACEHYAKLAAREDDMRQVHADSLREFLEANRKDEVSRIAALHEEHSRDDRVARIQKEYESHVAQLEKQFEALGKSHDENLRVLRERHEDELAAQENVHRRDVAIYASDNQRQQSRIDQLTASLTELDAKKEQEYAAKISELQALNQASEAKYDNLVKSQRKGNRLMIAIASLTAILCIAIGILAGYLMFSNLQAKNDLIDDLSEYYSTQEQAATADENVLPAGDGGDVAEPGQVTDTSENTDEPDGGKSNQNTGSEVAQTPET